MSGQVPAHLLLHSSLDTLHVHGKIGADGHQLIRARAEEKVDYGDEADDETDRTDAVGQHMSHFHRHLSCAPN